MSADCLEVLLIEDDPQDAFLLRKALAEADAVRLALSHVERLSEGLARLEEGRFDAVLLDLSLPDSRGLETFSRLHGAHPSVPIVVLTGADDDALALQAIQAGAQDYLVKGQVDALLLVRALRYAVERHRLQGELEREQARKRAQEERDRIEQARSRQLYLTMVQGAAGGGQKLDSEKALDDLLAEYHDLIRQYVHAVRFQEERPAEQVRAFADKLAARRLRARHVVHLHLRVLEAFSQHLAPEEERALANDARLTLVELMGVLMDIYLRIGMEVENQH